MKKINFLQLIKNKAKKETKLHNAQVNMAKAKYQIA
jgi:hypothetical protein